MVQDLTGVTILMVEDDDLDAIAIERAFKKLKLANPLMRARNGVEALAHLRGENGTPKINRPNIILLDLNMPRMSGLEFLEEVRGDPKLHDLVIFVLTTSKADEDKAAAYHGHVAGYIVKSDVGSEFTKVLQMLNYYWQIVQLPS